MIRKLTSGKYRLYSRKKNPKTGRRRNLGTFATRAAAEKHERAVQYFKRHSGGASFRSAGAQPGKSEIHSRRPAGVIDSGLAALRGAPE